MAIIPSVEMVLLEIAQSLGVGETQTKIKQKFSNRQYGFENHLKKLEEIVLDICRELKLDTEARHDLRFSIKEVIAFNKALEQYVWTAGADSRQVLWSLLGYSYMPMLGRKVAFWHLEANLDSGMPGGRFWYLPHLRPLGSELELVLPVVSVLDWLADLLGVSVKAESNCLGRGADEEGGAAEGNPLNIESNLRNWRKGRIPRTEKIDKIFPDDCELPFNGCFVPPTSGDLKFKVECARSFVQRKKLSADALREEIPMTHPGRIEAVLTGSASEEEQLRFVELLAVRYARPSMKTIRKRFYVARAVQDGYRRLVEFLCPGVELTCADPKRNQVLQLLNIYEHVYNFTIEASLQGSSWREEDEHFERLLTDKFPWAGSENFASILPSLRDQGRNAARYLGAKFTQKFSRLNGGEPLEDFIPYDRESFETIVVRTQERLAAESEIIEISGRLSNRLQYGSPWRTLQTVDNFEALSALVGGGSCAEKITLSVLARMKELAQTPAQKIRVILGELGVYLNGPRKGRSKDCVHLVSGLLRETDDNPATPLFKALVLQFKAKHALAQNDFQTAKLFFGEAFDDCFTRGYGTVRGEIARDTWALISAESPLRPEQQEQYYRNAVFFGIIPAGLSIKDAYTQIAEFFWTDLYKPYPGFKPKSFQAKGLSI